MKESEELKLPCFCVKQKKKVIPRDSRIVHDKNGHRRLTGICPECRSPVSRFLAS